ACARVVTTVVARTTTTAASAPPFMRGMRTSIDLNRRDARTFRSRRGGDVVPLERGAEVRRDGRAPRRRQVRARDDVDEPRALHAAAALHPHVERDARGAEADDGHRDLDRVAEAERAGKIPLEVHARKPD